MYVDLYILWLCHNLSKLNLLNSDSYLIYQFIKIEYIIFIYKNMKYRCSKVYLLIFPVILLLSMILYHERILCDRNIEKTNISIRSGNSIIYFTKNHVGCIIQTDYCENDRSGQYVLYDKNNPCNIITNCNVLIEDDISMFDFIIIAIIISFPIAVIIVKGDWYDEFIYICYIREIMAGRTTLFHSIY